METKTNPRFVGLIMALFMPGSAHMMSGRWKTGIIWYCSLYAIFYLSFFVLSIPVPLSFAAVIAIQVLFVSLLIIYYVSLLMSSYRPTTPRLGCCGWFLFVLTTLIINTIASESLQLLDKAYICREQKVTGWGMYPTLKADILNWEDIITTSILLYRFSDPRRGDIVYLEIFERPVRLCRRVVGLPGETVDICSPYVLINGEKLLEPPIFATISSCEDEYSGYVDTKETKYGENEEIVFPITLGLDEYFVLGDNSAESTDSRHFGPVSREKIVGKVVRIVFPPWRIREL